MNWKLGIIILVTLLFCTSPAQAEMSLIFGYEGEVQLGVAYTDLQRRPVSFIGYEEEVLDILVIQGWESKQLEGYIRWLERTSVGSVSYAYGGFAGNTLDFATTTRRFASPILMGLEGEYVQRSGFWGYGIVGRVGLTEHHFLYQAVPFLELHKGGRWRLSAAWGSEPLQLQFRYSARRAPFRFAASWQANEWNVRAVMQEEDWPLSLGVGYRNENVQLWLRWHF